MEVQAHGPRASGSDLIRGLDPVHDLPYGLLDLSDMIVVPVPLPRPEEAFEAIPAPPGNDVDVEVGDALADSVVDGDERAVRVHAQFDRSGQRLDVREQGTDQTPGQVIQGLVVLFGDEQAVAGEDWSMV